MGSYNLWAANLVLSEKMSLFGNWGLGLFGGNSLYVMHGIIGDIIFLHH